MKPQFKASWTTKSGKHLDGKPHDNEAHAQTDALEAVRDGAIFASILRDSGGTDHPDNAGKFFLHRCVKA
jgi:hypothetical protein